MLSGPSPLGLRTDDGSGGSMRIIGGDEADSSGKTRSLENGAGVAACGVALGMGESPARRSCPAPKPTAATSAMTKAASRSRLWFDGDGAELCVVQGAIVPGTTRATRVMLSRA